MNGEQYHRALTEVRAAATAYHSGVSDQHARDAVDRDGNSVWTPIYSNLLTELAAALESAGERYDSAADQVGTPAEQRFDWRSYLGRAGPEKDSSG